MDQLLEKVAANPNRHAAGATASGEVGVRVCPCETANQQCREARAADTDAEIGTADCTGLGR